MSARDQIIQALDGALDAGVDVLPYSRQIDPPSKPTVMVRLDEFRPSTDAAGIWDVLGALVVIEPKSSPPAADVDLEDLLSDVLNALDRQDVANVIRWATAKRATYGSTNPAFEVTFTTSTLKE